jgi:hypothetical protein
VVVEQAELSPLSDGAMVVRGGLMGSQGLWINAEDHHLEKLEEGQQGEWAISVFSAHALTAAEICRGGRIPHPQIRVLLEVEDA